MADDPWADDPNDGYGGRYDGAGGPDAADGPHADLGTYASDREVEAPNPKAATGCGVKALVLLLLGGGLLAALCCGGFLWEGMTAMPLDDTPAGVRAKTDEILTLDLPDDYAPELSLGGGVPVMRWLADVRVDKAVYRTPGGGQLQVSKRTYPADLADDPQKRLAVEDSMRQILDAANPRGVIVAATESGTRTLVTADGRTVDWVFAQGPARGRDGADRGAYRQVTGTIPDGDQEFRLQLDLPEENWDEAAVVSMLESIELIDPQTEPVPADKEAVIEEAVTDEPAATDDAATDDAETDDAATP